MNKLEIKSDINLIQELKRKIRHKQTSEALFLMELWEIELKNKIADDDTVIVYKTASQGPTGQMNLLEEFRYNFKNKEINK